MDIRSNEHDTLPEWLTIGGLRYLKLTDISENSAWKIIIFYDFLIVFVVFIDVN